VAASSTGTLKALNSGAYCPKLSPVLRTNTVGIHNVVPYIKAFEVGSHAVLSPSFKTYFEYTTWKTRGSGSCCHQLANLQNYFKRLAIHKLNQKKHSMPFQPFATVKGI